MTSQQVRQSVTRWLQAAGRVPLLTPAEELHLGHLVRAWQDHPTWLDESTGEKHDAGPDAAPAAVRKRGKRARDRMVAGNLRLVAKVAAKMAGPADLDDLLQNGALGLIRAAEKFDPAQGHKFSTYAYWWIRQAITPEHNAALLIRLPTQVAAAVRGEPGGSKSPDLVAAGRAARHVLSLDCPITEDGSDLLDTLAADLPGLVEQEQQEERDAAATKALAAIRLADSDAAALLELREDGISLRELAPLTGMGPWHLALKLRNARVKLRAVPDVCRLLGDPPAAPLLTANNATQDRQLELLKLAELPAPSPGPTHGASPAARSPERTEHDRVEPPAPAGEAAESPAALPPAAAERSD